MKIYKLGTHANLDDMWAEEEYEYINRLIKTKKLPFLLGMAKKDDSLDYYEILFITKQSLFLFSPFINVDISGRYTHNIRNLSNLLYKHRGVTLYKTNFNLHSIITMIKSLGINEKDNTDSIKLKYIMAQVGMQKFVEGSKLTSLHILLTGLCNMAPRCKGCYYPSDHTLPLEKVKSLIDEGIELGLKSVSLGGGEPTLYPEIEKLFNYINSRGLTASMTTNGIKKLYLVPHRVSISWDYIHHGLTLNRLSERLRYYHYWGSKVGVNHIVTDLRLVEKLIGKLYNYPDKETSIYLLLEKPTPRFTEWDSLKKLLGCRDLLTSGRVWLDPCLSMKLGLMKECDQGLHSLTVKPDGSISKCSNLCGYQYNSLREAWGAAKKDVRCGVRDGFSRDTYEKIRNFLQFGFYTYSKIIKDYGAKTGNSISPR